MNPKHKCLYCQYTATRLWNLKRHLQSVHRNNKLNDCGNSEDIIQHHQYKCQQSQEQHQLLPFKKASSMRQPEFHTKSECPIHPSEYRSIQQHQQTFDDEQKSRNGSNQFQGHHNTYDGTISRDEIIQEKHPPMMKAVTCHQLLSDEYAGRFEDASTQYSNHDMSYSQMSHDATKSRDENCKKRKPIVINSKGVFILE